MISLREETNGDVHFLTSFGSANKNMTIRVRPQMTLNSGQGGFYGPHSYQFDIIHKSSYSLSPDWEMILDDNGAGSTVIGTNVQVLAYRGTSTTPYNLQVINQLYHKEIIYNGKNYVQGIDFYDTTFDMILGSGRDGGR